MELDDIDREILRILQEDARTPFSEVARRIDMSSATVHDRVDQMEEAGVLEGYHAQVDPVQTGYGSQAFVGIRVEEQNEEVAEELGKMSSVTEVHLTSGTLDIILRVQASSTDEIKQVVFNDIGQVDHIHRTNIMLILSTEKDDSEIPIS
jgi:Lrp/AsnC family transcriptional regulator for asnA, asnC and gidA